jgi:cytochrome c oxidase cbb3-type subunit 3
LSYVTLIVSLVSLPGGVVVADPLDIEAGRRTFMVHCDRCHGPGGRGGIGPNLTDQFTLHGGTYEDIVNVVTNGVPGKPMFPWKDWLDPATIRKVAEYVYSLKGTRPADAPSEPYKLM